MENGRMKSLRILVAIGILGLVTSSFAISRPGRTFAQPGTTATVRLALNPDQDVLFNRHGPSVIRVIGQFTKPLEQKLPKGTPYPPDAQNYDQSVPTISFKIPIPKNTKPGAYTITLETELYLCDAVQHICYRTTPKLQTIINVGLKGRDQDAVLELTRPTKPGV
jgi:hypothetical protein